MQVVAVPVDAFDEPFAAMRVVAAATVQHAPVVECQQVAACSGIAPWRLGRLFKRLLRQTPAQYYVGLRLARARHLLRNSQHQVGIIASRCGFDNHETFSRAYRRAFGVAPSQDRGL